MSDETPLNQYDDLFRENSDVAAIVIRERLRPVQGPFEPFFPPTFAGIGQGRKSDYHIDPIGPKSDDPQGAESGSVLANRCTVDSVPSQANRLESRLLRYSGVHIPKVTISGSRVGERVLDLLEVGHRVADAVVRYTADGGFNQFEEGMRAFTKGDARPLARLAPTSLVFGHWDSRGETKAKARRLLRSEIVAYNVARCTKRSQYWSSIDPEVNDELGQFLKEAKDTAARDPETKNPASQLGMTDVPAPESPGGVIAFGRIERTSIISLSGLRNLAAYPAATAEAGLTSEPNSEMTLSLRRYLFALALAAVADIGFWDLREGCLLVRNGPPPGGTLREGQSPLTIGKVAFSGGETPFAVCSDVDNYVQLAAKSFFGAGLPQPIQLIFDPAGAKGAVDEKGGGKAKAPKSKAELVAALITLPDYKDHEAELKKKKSDELRRLWNERFGSGAPSSQVPASDNPES